MQPFTKEEVLSGQVILIDKPLTWSSFQAVKKVKYVLQKSLGLPKRFKIGHAGTLDPLATGLLILCTGKFTKKITEIQGQIKTYEGVITLGATRSSYDKETEIDAHFPIEHITEEKIEEAKAQFIGKIEQFPPVFSAIKKDGKRLYEHARAGTEVEISSRTVEILDFQITKIQLPDVSFRVVCSKGTYIRSLAHDFGKALQSGAYLSELRRTKIGDYSVEDAISPLDFEDLYKNSNQDEV